MTTLDDLETPCVVIDLARVEANLKRVQDHATANGYALRPHIKTHKLPRFAKRALELGAVGITVQKLADDICGAAKGNPSCPIRTDAEQPMVVDSSELMAKCPSKYEGANSNKIDTNFK